MLLLLIACNFLIAALWAGAITPVLSTTTSQTSITIPDFSNITMINSSDINAPPKSLNLDTGIFSYLPELDLQGVILNAAQDASPRNNSQTVHAKLDKTGYVYLNRSYGVGSSIGIVQTAPPYVTTYSFTETGIRANASCSYNKTSEWMLNPFPQNGLSIRVFNAEGVLPNGFSPIYAAVGLSGDGVVALGAGTNTGDSSPSHWAALATGNGTIGKYGSLDKIQCEIFFTPTLFAISVNMSNKVITVLPLQEVDETPTASGLAWRLTHALNNLGSVFSSTIWISVIGEAFVNNMANVHAREGVSKSSNLTAIVDVFESVLDNMLIAYGGAQATLDNHLNSTTGVQDSVSVVFGSAGYIYAVLAINLLLCGAYVFEMCRTRGWRGLSKINFMDIKSMIIGASNGGSALAKSAHAAHHTRGTKWYAAGDDVLVGRLRIRLRMSSKDEFSVKLATDEDQDHTDGQPDGKMVRKRLASTGETQSE